MNERVCDECIWCHRSSDDKSDGCEWLKGRFEDSDRPDRLGLMFSTTKQMGRRVLTAHQLTSPMTSDARKKLDDTAQKEMVFLIRGEKLYVLGRRETTEDMRRMMSRARRQ